MKNNCKLIFYNADSPDGYRTEIINCHPDSVERIISWYGGYHAGDNVDLHIDGVRQKLDENLELITNNNS